MNQYLYTTSPVRVNTFHNPTGEEADYLEQHDQYIQKLTKDGTVIFSGALRLVERRPFALTIFQAEDDAAANTIVNNDPAVKDRILIGRLFPYRVALWNYESTQLANDQNENERNNNRGGNDKKRHKPLPQGYLFPAFR